MNTHFYFVAKNVSTFVTTHGLLISIRCFRMITIIASSYEFYSCQANNVRMCTEYVNDKEMDGGDREKARQNVRKQSILRLSELNETTSTVYTYSGML